MSSSNRSRDESPAAHEPATPGSGSPTGGADAYASWLDRMQRARARQAAITRNLYTWSNYKNWAERMRDSFGAEGPVKPEGGAPQRPPGVKR